MAGVAKEVSVYEAMQNYQNKANLDKRIKLDREANMLGLKKPKPKYRTVIRPEFGESRKTIRQNIKKQLRESKRQKEGVATHWTYRQCIQRYEYGGIQAIYDYYNEVKRCGGKGITLERISGMIKYINKQLNPQEEKAE